MQCLNCQGDRVGFTTGDDGSEGLVCFDCGFVEELD